MCRSIAEAVDRPFVRLSLGGVSDEAEIRGHRRTYLGAMPGNIIRALARVGSDHPVIMLDELDKLGRDGKGDPAAALLEVLDAQQRRRFLDHYLEVPFDLSRVFFIATANTLDGVSPALRDLLEIIQLSGYTENDIHVHVPSGAVQKDGPSAGVTLAVALVSLLTGAAVSHDLAMSGEITLRGRILPVGGIKEKVLAARRTGINRLILPAANSHDLDDLPIELLAGLDIVPAETMDDVLAASFPGTARNAPGDRRVCARGGSAAHVAENPDMPHAASTR